MMRHGQRCPMCGGSDTLDKRYTKDGPTFRRCMECKAEVRSDFADGEISVGERRWSQEGA